MSLFQSFRNRVHPGGRGRKRLLLITDQHLTVYDWENGLFQELGHFSQEERELDFFEATVEADRDGMPIHILVDVIEEELRREVIPRLWGSNRDAVIQRRLARLFHGTPYRRSVAQGRQPDGREQLIFSGLTNPALVAPWIACLGERSIPVAGIWSLQLLSRELLREIDTRSDYALLISIHSSGMRQTCFHRGRTVISRMTILRTDPEEDLPVSLVRDELTRTRQYLNTLRLLPPGTILDLYVLGNAAVSASDPAQWEGIGGDFDRARLLNTAELARDIGLTGGLDEGGAELLYAQLLLRHPPPSHYRHPNGAPASTEAERGPGGWLRRLLFKRSQPDEQRAAGGTPVRRLGDLLLEKAVITQDQLATALSEQRQTGNSLGKVMVSLGFIPESAMRDLLAEILNHESMDLAEAPPHPGALKRVPKAFAKRHGVLPVLFDAQAKILVVATSNPLNVAVLDKLQARMEPGVTIKPVLASEGEIADAIDRFYGFELSVDGILRELETGEEDLESLSETPEGFSHPMVRLVNALLTDAVKRNASDIHIGPTAGFVRVRFRIDGVLRQIHSLHRNILSGLLVRVKVMAGMDIAETRLPQDGRITFDMSGHVINFRVSAHPTIHGENLVFRVLDLRDEIKTPDHLRLTAPSRDALLELLRRPEGLILVTGPTGSGKTTTLYSLLNYLNDEGVNVMTMEDPVEYPMPTVLQTHINKSIGLDYAAGIRSMLWQDPDVILVGEVHDRETASMALQAAMTGHQVLATLHANSALGAIPRLMNLDVATDFIEGNINGIIAQRLVRQLCPACRVSGESTVEERRLLGLPEDQPFTLSRPVGCEACFHSGYKGRLPVMEVLPMDEAYDDLIHVGAAKGAFRKLAAARGVRSMAKDAKSRVLAGETTLEEIGRVLVLSHPTPSADGPADDDPAAER